MYQHTGLVLSVLAMAAGGGLIVVAGRMLYTRRAAVIVAEVVSVPQDRETERFRAVLREAQESMEVKDDLGDPLELEVRHRLDGMQVNCVEGFAHRIDKALADFGATAADPLSWDRLPTGTFLAVAELGAWSSGLAGSIRKGLTLDSDTCEITPELMAEVLGRAGR